MIYLSVDFFLVTAVYFKQSKHNIITKYVIQFIDEDKM